MKRVAKINFEAEVSAAGSSSSSSGGSGGGGGREGVMNKAFLRSDRMFDFAAMVHNYDSSGHGQIKKSHFTKLLNDAGACIDSADVQAIFRYFDFNINGSVSREEYCQVVGLTEAELAQVVEKIRTKLLSTCKPSSSSSSSSSKDAAGSEAAKVAKTKAAVRTNRVLGEVFRLVNSNDDGIISLDEVLDLTGKLEIFVTEGEAARVFRAMDVNSDGRVEEADFVSFMKRSSELAVRTG
jgi:Ca2+-binding EF-hand superfamily protein